jgi:hypothetical protein
VANRNHPLDWVGEAERLINSLRNVKDCSITVQGDEILEINVLADGERPPKQIVRDVRSALKAELKLDIDYRKISVALKREDVEGLASESGGGPTVLELLPAADKSRPENRLRFGGVTVSLNTLRCTVNVELGLGEQEAMGEAIGSNSRQQVPRLIAEATLRAVERFLGGDYALCLNDLELVSVGADTIAVVNVKFQMGRRLQTLSGSCVVDHDLQQSVVYATLDSLNRILGQLIIKEPVEYELRPTSI